MKKTKSIFSQILNRLAILTMLTGIVFMMTEIQAQEVIHGFKLIEMRFVKEVNAECYSYRHIKSGARLLKIAADDPNKMFGIAFKTIPNSDNGAPHILEHSVLNGSRKFPVKSPFDVLSKGSLKTFLNAMTGKDITFYPVASMNNKDYFNLMNVYLDAVLNPLLYSDPKILQQEGWHYDLSDKDSPVTYKGVVYGEMKGAFSNPEEELGYQIYKNLFPDNGYGFESGGYPAAIPTLTQESFTAFHKRFYHPENSYIILYGNADLDKELEFIDKEYLSKYSRANSRVTIEDQKPFAAMKDITASYPVMEGSDTTNQTFLSLTLVAGHNTDGALNMALDVITELLVNQETAPIRLALQKAGIGQDVSASVSNYKQNVVQITVQNANAGDKQKFYEIVMNSIGQTLKKGFDKSEIQGVLNRSEFHLREGNNVQKGLVYLMQIYPGWFFGDDPFQGLEYEKPLTEVKKSLTTDYLEAIVKKYFINNPHSILVTLVPEPLLDKKRNAMMQEELKNYKSKLDDAGVASLVKGTQDLVAFQKQEDTPQALATIPSLTLKDIDPKAIWYGVTRKQVAGIPVLHHETFTNDIIYASLYFDMRTVPQEMIPYISLLSNLLGSMNTEKYSYGDLNKAMNINTGALYTTLRSYLENLNDSNLIPKFVVVSSAMKDKVDKALELSAEIVNKTQFTDTARLKTLLVRHQSQLEASKKQEGAGVAATRLPSYYSNSGMFNELTNGLDYYWFVTELTKGFDKNSDQIIANLKKASKLLFTKGNLMASATCAAKDLPAFEKGVTKFAASLPQTKPVYQTWTFKPEKKNEGILAASKVQYVYEGYNFKKLGFSWNGKMRVLNQILSRDWLRTRIRIIGGAYGAAANISPTGMIFFSSYRDPNLKETFETYSGASDYLAKFEADEPGMTRYIIGTVAGMDMPQSNVQRGDQAMNYYFTKRTAEDLQRDRDAVIATTVDDIRGFAAMIKAMTGQRAWCVYGNSDKLNASKELFDSLIQVDR
ncbi:MAG: insulinase family protein [Bacteroidetes bacterium]|nr:insulinase family protein [Bacteroidota bacterium]